VFKCAICIYW